MRVEAEAVVARVTAEVLNEAGTEVVEGSDAAGVVGEGCSMPAITGRTK
jgi:hypothetical protein